MPANIIAIEMATIVALSITITYTLWSIFTYEPLCTCDHLKIGDCIRDYECYCSVHAYWPNS